MKSYSLLIGPGVLACRSMSPWAIIPRARLFLSYVAFSALVVAAHPSQAQHWTATSAPTNAWAAVACSASGQTVVAVAYGGPIFVSTNWGRNWTQANVDVGYWTCVAVSADGTRVTAAALFSSDAQSTGGVIISDDGGASWSWTGSVNYWHALACGADGVRLVAGSAFQTTRDMSLWAYTSSDQGVIWANYSNEKMGAFCSVACSADASKVFASTSDGLLGMSGRDDVFVSTNFGVNWDWVGNLGSLASERATSIACSADGNQLVLATSPGPILIARSPLNWSTTWRAIGPVAAWSGVASSADGTRLVATVYGGSIYSSTNSGTIWTINDAPSRNWRAVASSSDGGRLVAVVENGGIFTTQTIPAPTLKITIANGWITLAWAASLANFSLQQSPDLTAPQWSDVGVAPTITNMQARVVLPVSGDRKFYRLRASY